MKKFIFAPLIALMAILAYVAPANATEGPDWNAATHGPECNAFGTECTNTFVKFWYTAPSGGQVIVNQARVYAGNPAGLRGNNALTINRIEVDGPAGALKWVRNDVQVDKSGPGTVEQYFQPSFSTGVNSTYTADITLHWADGTNDRFTLGGSIN